LQNFKKISNNSKYYTYICGVITLIKNRIVMKIFKMKTITGHVALYGGIFVAILMFIGSISSVRPVEGNGTSVAGDKFLLFEQKEKPNVESVGEKTVVFCDEEITQHELDFMLEFIASTESQGHKFMPKDSAIKARAWKVSNDSSSALGKWQMLRGTRISCAKYLDEKIPTDREFVNDTLMQKRYIVAYFEMCNDVFNNMPKLDKKGKVVLDAKGAVIRYNAYNKYVGCVIGGCYITKSGMLVLAHSIGVAGATMWMDKGCKPKNLPKGAPIAMNGLTCQIF
jgi:hypothetical protein